MVKQNTTRLGNSAKVDDDWLSSSDNYDTVDIIMRVINVNKFTLV